MFMKKLPTILSFVAAAISALGMSATTFGYSDGTCDRANMFRVGNGASQGLAIRIPHDKLVALKGCTITSISATFGSSHTTTGQVTVFVGTTPTVGIVEDTYSISRALQWNEFTLSTPYTITGEEPELYIGYQGDISTSASLNMHDGTPVIPATCYALSGSDWVDIAPLGFGSANIRFNLDGAPSMPDAIIKPIDTMGYYKAETPYSFSGQIFNFGSEKITSFDLKTTIGNNASTVKHFDNLDIAPASNFDFTLDPYTAYNLGLLPISLEVMNVNGAADLDAADNTFAGDICMYPADMERTALLEGFTGQECGNCPSGHAATEKWLETVPDSSVILVMHHSGYKPDYFSMDADYDYTFFFGSTSTYAPAEMMNRTLFPSISTYPVWGPSGNTFQQAYDIVMATQPYVSLKLDSSYDPTTREVKLSFKSLAHNDLPAPTNVFNIMLVQDGLTGYQSGGGNSYIHDNVFRGTITGDSWGKLLPKKACVAGGEYEWNYTFTLPESIFSDYWKNTEMTDKVRERYTHAVVPQNMKLVAYVGALGGEAINGHTVYNAIEVPLGASHEQGGISGVESVADASSAIDITVSGTTLVVKGDYDTLELYNLRGIAVNPAETLAPGFYIARAVKGSNVTVKKLIVK